MAANCLKLSSISVLAGASQRREFLAQAGSKLLEERQRAETELVKPAAVGSIVTPATFGAKLLGELLTIGRRVAEQRETSIIVILCRQARWHSAQNGSDAGFSAHGPSPDLMMRRPRADFSTRDAHITPLIGRQGCHARG